VKDLGRTRWPREDAAAASVVEFLFPSRGTIDFHSSP
jgi:hypothetical protein